MFTTDEGISVLFTTRESFKDFLLLKQTSEGVFQ